MFNATWWCDWVLSFKRSWAIRARERFFREIVQAVSGPIDKIANMFGQSMFYGHVDTANVISEPEFGTLYIPVKVTFEGTQCDHAWSIYQTGNRLRIAVILSGGLESAVLVDWNREMVSFWPEAQMEQKSRKDLTLYEWSFHSSRVYTDYVAQESFSLNMRHCHIRMLRILFDYAVLKKGSTE